MGIKSVTCVDFYDAHLWSESIHFILFFLYHFLHLNAYPDLTKCRD